MGGPAAPEVSVVFRPEPRAPSPEPRASEREPFRAPLAPSRLEGTVRYAIVSSLIVLALLGSATAGYAQETPSRLAVDVSGGHAAFVDETPIGHFTLGGGVRWQLTPKVSVGPEFVFMRGPDDDRDVFLTGKVIVDFMPDRLVSPYFVADGGRDAARRSVRRAGPTGRAKGRSAPAAASAST